VADRRPWLAASLLCACTVPGQREVAAGVRRDVAERAGVPAEARPDVRAVLADGLTADEAARLAVANGPDVEAALLALGAERGDLLAASVAPNPEIEAAVRLPLDGEGARYELTLLQNLSDFLAIPGGRRAASARLDAARLRAVEAAVDRAAEARAAFRRVQTDARVLDLRRTALEIAGASFEVAQRLREAGNVTALEVDLQQAESEEARLALAAAEASLLRSRARLERLTGLWGADADWRPAAPLPALPAAPDADLDALEARAVERSLALAAVRGDMAAAEGAASRDRLAGWMPRLAAGATAEREAEGGWAVGPAFAVGLPLFDRHQGAVARAEAEASAAGARLRARALDVRSSARAVALRLRAARDRAAFLGGVLAPLRRRVLERSVLQFNAMTIGIFELLRARRDVVEVDVRHAEALRDYWLARGDADRLLAGGSPEPHPEGEPP
jgi:cobalt-zinc-cadmium efflux system outer membrane protein